MKIKVIVENFSVDKKVKKQHGLSLYIELNNKNILLDLGYNSLFLKNLKAMDIDIKDIDILVISHGHSDHIGGLKYFLEENKKAKVYLKKEALDKHYTRVLGMKFNIGLSAIEDNERFIYTSEIESITDNIKVFSLLKDTKVSKTNKNLFMEVDSSLIQDDFSHEQSLIIRENNNYVLLSSCSHKGILNILDKAMEITDNKINYVIGGFHLWNPVNKKNEDVEEIISIRRGLNKYKDCKFYTCHCTGKFAFRELKSILEDKISYISAGQEIII